MDTSKLKGMPIKWAPKKCAICGKTMEVGSGALVDTEAHPWAFYHSGCLETPNGEEIEALEEIFAMLADVQSDIRILNAKVQSIYEATFPAEPKPKVI